MQRQYCKHTVICDIYHSLGLVLTVSALNKASIQVGVLLITMLECVLALQSRLKWCHSGCNRSDTGILICYMFKTETTLESYHISVCVSVCEWRSPCARLLCGRALVMLGSSLP